MSRKAKAPAQVLREAKAKIDEANKVPMPRPSGQRHPASDAAEAAGRARATVAELKVPMTLAEICTLMGAGCEPDNFAVSALDTLAGQLQCVATLAESDQAGYEGWSVLQNISDRMKCASNVASWLQSEGSQEVPS